VFAGKHGFITPRDLFKWAARGAVGYQELAESGFLLLGERLRPHQHPRGLAGLPSEGVPGAAHKGLRNTAG